MKFMRKLLREVQIFRDVCLSQRGTSSTRWQLQVPSLLPSIIEAFDGCARTPVGFLPGNARTSIFADRCVVSAQ
jgi:hypothetical protein